MIDVNKEKLSDLIATGESETVEFKESFGDEALETIGAFANAHGGILFVGIKDSGDVLGVPIGKKTLEDIANRIQEATDPRLQPSISIAKDENKQIIVIQVSSVTSTPVSVRGRYFRRTGKSNQRMSHDEIMRRMVASTGLSWDAIIEPTATLADLDANYINRFVQTIKEKGRTNSEYQAITNVSKRTATRELHELKEKGILVSKGTTGRGFTYHLKDPF